MRQPSESQVDFREEHLGNLSFLVKKHPNLSHFSLNSEFLMATPTEKIEAEFVKVENHWLIISSSPDAILGLGRGIRRADKSRENRSHVKVAQALNWREDQFIFAGQEWAVKIDRIDTSNPHEVEMKLNEFRMNQRSYKDQFIGRILQKIDGNFTVYYDVIPYYKGYKDLYEDSQSPLITTEMDQLEQAQEKVEGILDRCIALGNSLARLHEDNIVMGEVKAENALYNPQTRDAKYVDFAMGYLIGEQQAVISTDKHLLCVEDYFNEQTLHTDLYRYALLCFELWGGYLEPPALSESEEDTINEKLMAYNELNHNSDEAKLMKEELRSEVKKLLYTLDFTHAGVDLTIESQEALKTFLLKLTHIDNPQARGTARETVALWYEFRDNLQLKKDVQLHQDIGFHIFS